MALTSISQFGLHIAGPQPCLALTVVSNSTARATLRCMFNVTYFTLSLRKGDSSDRFRPFGRLAVIEYCLTISHARKFIDSSRRCSTFSRILAGQPKTPLSNYQTHFCAICHIISSFRPQVGDKLYVCDGIGWNPHFAFLSSLHLFWTVSMTLIQAKCFEASTHWLP